MTGYYVTTPDSEKVYYAPTLPAAQEIVTSRRLDAYSIWNPKGRCVERCDPRDDDTGSPRLGHTGERR